MAFHPDRKIVVVPEVGPVPIETELGRVEWCDAQFPNISTILVQQGGALSTFRKYEFAQGELVAAAERFCSAYIGRPIARVSKAACWSTKT